MPHSKEPKQRLRLASPASSKYDVGFGKPPEATRFRPGQSGNPRGRPRGSKNKLPALNEERLKTIVLEEAYRTIKVRDGEKSVSIQMAKAVVRSLALTAAKGNNRAAHLFTALLTTTERENKALHDEFLNTAIEYKVQWERELERRQQFGIIAPEPLPHPDHIVIDMDTGQVLKKGPWTKEEKVKWDMFRERKKECDLAIAEYEMDLQRSNDEGYRNFLEQEIRFEKKIRTIICRLIPD